MPYRSTAELPNNIKQSLPYQAQRIYKVAFNDALVQYADLDEHSGDRSKEAIAHKVAWHAVEQEYRKNNSGHWVRKPH